ncbi:MAG: hypothetical protein ACEPOZ_01950 [Marinifilaceae bacterium]
MREITLKMAIEGSGAVAFSLSVTLSISFFEFIENEKAHRLSGPFLAWCFERARVEMLNSAFAVHIII